MKLSNLTKTVGSLAAIWVEHCTTASPRPGEWGACVMASQSPRCAALQTVLNCTTHYTTLHYTTLHFAADSTVHSTALHCTPRCTLHTLHTAHCTHYTLTTHCHTVLYFAEHCILHTALYSVAHCSLYCTVLNSLHYNGLTAHYTPSLYCTVLYWATGGGAPALCGPDRGRDREQGRLPISTHTREYCGALRATASANLVWYQEQTSLTLFPHWQLPFSLRIF